MEIPLLMIEGRIRGASKMLGRTSNTLQMPGIEFTVRGNK